MRVFVIFVNVVAMTLANHPGQHGHHGHHHHHHQPHGASEGHNSYVNHVYYKLPGTASHFQMKQVFQLPAGHALGRYYFLRSGKNSAHY